jgi:DNA-binding XRE family transcriptional regulator
MDQRSYTLMRNIALLTQARARAYSPALARDRILQRLTADLVAARTTAGMTQQDVALRMSTTKSTVSRLESGTRTRPSLRTIQGSRPHANPALYNASSLPHARSACVAS